MASPALSAAITGAQAAQTQIDILANNIANLNTVAFKKSNVETADLFYQTLKRAGTIENAEASRRPVAVQVGYGTKVIGTNRNLQQGSIIQTGQPLDIAILKTGYLAITLPNGRTGFTRAGLLKRDPETGNIVTTDGYPLTNGLQIPENVLTDDITIAADGTITGLVDGNPNEVAEIGQVELYTFPNERGLVAIGNNTFEETQASGEAILKEDLSDSFQQRAREGSNVSAVEELTELITAQRAFELNSRVIRVTDEILKDANNIK